MSRRIERHLASTTFEVRGVDDGARQIVGYAAVFNSPTTIRGAFGDYTERIRPGAFAKTIQEADVRALFNHNENFVLGRNKSGTLRLSEDAVGLRMEIDLPDTSYARDLMASMGRGDINQSSFAFSPIAQEWQRAQSVDQIDERTLNEVRLYDVSVVTYPAYPDTTSAVRQASFDPLAMRALARFERVQTLDVEDVEALRQLVRSIETSLGPENHPESEPPVGHSLELLRRKLAILEKEI
jgi:HK97 family phage prohead protease